MRRNFFIGEQDFRIWLPEVNFIEKSKDAFNSRQISGVMSTSRKDRQGENVLAKGLTFEEFLKNGHFNDNHSQETSAIVGYPESVEYHKDLSDWGVKSEGWTCEGYILKGTKRADAIWELAKALAEVPNRKLGFSIEGKVVRRSDKTIEKANIRNVAITNCPVNTDCTWDVLVKSMDSAEEATKALTSVSGAALAPESLDKDVKDVMEQKKKREEALKKALCFDDLLKSMELVLERRPDFDDETAAIFINHLFKKGGRL